MSDRRQARLALTFLAMATPAIALCGCDGGGGGSTPPGQATPNEFLDVNESASPPDSPSKAAKPKPR